MASRTKQKEEARARRMAEERARQETERRRRRLAMLGGVVLSAIIVVVVAIVISSSGGTNAGLKHGTQASQTAKQVNQLLAGIQQSGPVLGNPHAPVTMDYYGDLECPVCKDFTLDGGFPQLVQNEVRTGKVKIVFKAFQTATPDRQTFLTQQAAALAAGKQNLFWNYVELFYRQQGQESTGYVTESYLDGLAQQIPTLNLNAWKSARNDSALSTQVNSDNSSGTALGVTGTPTVIFTGPKGKASPNTTVPSYSDLQQAIKSVS